MDPNDSTVKDIEQSGFYSEYGYNIGLSVSTRVFGIVKPKIFGLNALRHTFQPSVGFNYTPDQSDPSLGFYGLYKDLRTGQQVKYSRFAADGGGIASSYKSKSLNYSINNNLGAKISQGDTAQDKAIDIFSLSLNGGYNFAADSLRFSDINMSFHTPAIGNINFNGAAAVTLYDEARIINKETKLPTDYYTRINKFLISEGKGPARLTSFSLSLSTSFNSSGMNANSGGFFDDTTQNRPKDTLGLGERFQKRIENKQSNFDFFGDNLPGYSPISFPWNLSFSLNYNYSRPTINTKTQSLNLSVMGSLKLTETWSIDANAQYDFERHELSAPIINIKKDMHCWDLVFTWYPIGTNQGFYLRFAIKTPQLRDLKLEKRSNPLF